MSRQVQASPQGQGIAAHTEPKKRPHTLVDAQYQYKPMEGLPGVAVAAWVPPTEYFSLKYITERLHASMQLIHTRVANFVLFEKVQPVQEHNSFKVRAVTA
jgi:hypothetical protein